MTREERIFRKLQAASMDFDSFDGDDFDPNDFDPNEFDGDEFEGDFATGQRRRRPTKRVMNPGDRTVTGGYFTITIVNSTGGVANCELFNPNQSIFKYSNSQRFPNVIPFNAVNRNAANLNLTAYIDNNGNGVINNAAGAAVTISCNEIQYAGLLAELANRKVSLSRLKMMYVNEAQLDRAIEVFSQTFMGKKTSNTLNPRVYFKDSQFQTKQVTIPGKFDLDPSSGLYLTLNAGETVTLNFFLASSGCSC